MSEIQPAGSPGETRFVEALVHATRLHAGQKRKGSGAPYISHLLAVASLVIEYGGDEEEAIAALLHDSIEDQGGAETRAEILRRYGERVVAIVEGCSDSVGEPKPPWRERKKAFIERMATAPESVRRVAAADKLHNLRSLLKDYREAGESLWNRFKGGKEGTLWYYGSILVALRQAGADPLVEEMERVWIEFKSLVARSEPPDPLDS